jgi:hypothetical protein
LAGRGGRDVDRRDGLLRPKRPVLVYPVDDLDRHRGLSDVDQLDWHARRLRWANDLWQLCWRLYALAGFALMSAAISALWRRVLNRLRQEQEMAAVIDIKASTILCFDACAQL